MKLRAIVVDDEEFARKNLVMLLEEFCPEIEVIGEAERKDQAKAIIEASQPDVVFLDIRMPSNAEGFELLEEIEEKNFQVVFVTAFKDYAIKAFNASAVYYLLKPIDIEELQLAVKKLVESKEIYTENPSNYSTYFDSLKNLSYNLLRNKPNNRIAISHTKGLKIVEDDTILHLEASGNCTTIYFKDGTRYLDTRTLKTYEEMLDESKFARIHKSHIINLNELSEYLNEEGHFAILKNGLKLPIARNRVTDFIKMLKQK
ncbi:MAG: LytTR family DNA-binding domain-containing protein [Crocinitomicaceae bacterium]|jgi:two-component system LytT family response regulator|nr:LytTR family DNA-binding domain-containing protein [Taishania sp.]